MQQRNYKRPPRKTAGQRRAKSQTAQPSPPPPEKQPRVDSAAAEFIVGQHWVVAVRLFFSPTAENPVYTNTRLDDQGEDKPRHLFRFLRWASRFALGAWLSILGILASAVLAAIFGPRSWTEGAVFVCVLLVLVLGVSVVGWGMYVAKFLLPNDELIVKGGKCSYISSRSPFQDPFGREIPLNQITAVEVTVPALWGPLLHYGHLLIRARGNDAPIYRRYTPYPGEVKKAIDRLREGRG